MHSEHSQPETSLSNNRRVLDKDFASINELVWNNRRPGYLPWGLLTKVSVSVLLIRMTTPLHVFNCRIGIGWIMKTSTEAQSATTNYHVMGFKADAGAPGVTDKASGEGAFYWDSTNDDLYVCTNAYTNTGGG